MATNIPISQVSTEIAAAAKAADGGKVTYITRYNQRLAAIVHADDADELEEFRKAAYGRGMSLAALVDRGLRATPEEVRPPTPRPAKLNPTEIRFRLDARLSEFIDEASYEAGLTPNEWAQQVIHSEVARRAQAASASDTKADVRHDPQH